MANFKDTWEVQAGGLSELRSSGPAWAAHQEHISPHESILWWVSSPGAFLEEDDILVAEPTCTPIGEWQL